MSSVSPKILEQAVTDVINAINLEETTLSQILNLQQEIMQRTKNDSASLEEYVAINESAKAIIGRIVRIQRMNRIILEHIKKIVQTVTDMNQSGFRTEQI